MQNSATIKQSLKAILKTNFKKYLKSKEIPQITILILVPDLLTPQNQKDLQLLCEFLETNQFSSQFYETKDHKYKFNLMKQLKIKSLQSVLYEHFVTFCKEKIHFVFGVKMERQKLSKFFNQFKPILRKTHVKLETSKMSDFSQV